MGNDTGAELPGLDLSRFGAWLADTIPGAGPQLQAQFLAGGKSNLTYAVTDGRSEWILRRPPVGELLATAHDMAREYRVMAALQDSAVPVPVTYALCQDESVLGAPFYLMQRVAGRPYRFVSEIERLGPERTREISTGLVDVLARLHAVDPAEVGLADFGRPAGFLARQVRRWHQQLQKSHTRDLPGADELHRLLEARVPEESAAGIVHGDYRLDNVLIDDEDRLVAVIDWEMATLGDPLTDLALMLVYGRLGAQSKGIQPGGVPSGSGVQTGGVESGGVQSGGPTNTVVDVASAPGYLSEDEIIERYAAGSARDLSDFGFYLGLATFKLVGILEGIHHRFVNGQTVGEGFDSIGTLVEPLLEQGLIAVKEYS